MLTKMRSTALFAALAVLPMLAVSQTRDDRAVLHAAVAGSLRVMFGDSTSATVEKLIKVKPTGAISQNFDISRVKTALFGRLATQDAADCRTTKTASGEPDEGMCLVESGNRDSPEGAYTMLTYSKNVGMGNVQFVRRPRGSALPPPVKLSDADAYAQALKFVDLIGLPRDEIPVAPAGVKLPLPVRSLVVGSESDKGTDATRITIDKVVTLSRAFVVPGLLVGPNKEVLNHVIAPGSAVLLVNDAGVQAAQIDGWSDAQMDPKLDPRLAKNTSDLADEITDDLYGEGVRKVGTLSILIALRRAYPNPEDPNPPLCPVCGVLRPALRVMISQTPAGRIESSEKAYVAPGVVREYDLVATTEAERPSR